MKKTNVVSLHEILASDVQSLNEYLEEAFSLFSSDFLQTSSGVITGLLVEQNGVSGLIVPTGAIYQLNSAGLGVFGQLEASSGIVQALPTVGTRTDLVCAYYAEVEDEEDDGYVLLDVDTRAEAIQTSFTRKFGAAIIQVLASTTASTCPANRIPLAEVAMSTSTITSVTDVRAYARIQRFVTDIQLKYNMMFAAGF